MSHKQWLFITIFLFGFGLLLGLLTPSGIAALPPQEQAELEELVEFLSSLQLSSVFIFIFIKNVLVLLTSFVLSPIFCLMPVTSLILNGWLIGLVSTTVIQEKSLGLLLASLLPHGIFELPALLIGEAAALSFGTAIILALFKRGRQKSLLSNLKQNLRYLALAIALLLPAAIIETYITPIIIGRVI